MTLMFVGKELIFRGMKHVDYSEKYGKNDNNMISEELKNEWPVVNAIHKERDFLGVKKTKHVVTENQSSNGKYE